MSLQETLTLVALQITPYLNLKETILQITQLISTTKSETNSIDCIVLPEYAFGTFHEWSTMNRDLDQFIDQIHSAIGKLANQYKVPIVAGSIPYRTEKNTWRNRSYLFSASGDLVGSYDKQHPFRSEKHLGLEPGCQTPIFSLDHLRMAILICADLWYHNIISEVAPKLDFIAVPTMTTVLDKNHIQYGQWVWQSLMTVRSKEYTIPIVSADQVAREYAPGVFTCGASCIADPSHRFTNDESPNTQALRRVPDEKAHYVLSKISLKALEKYAAYRRDVGLRE